MTANEYVNFAPLPEAYIQEIGELVEKRQEPLWAAVGVFAYGYIIGKREERARRKKRKQPA